MRLKSTWFKPGAAKSPAEQAGAMGFIVFRVAHQMLKRMRSANFDIDAGRPYFAFLAEVLVFLVAVTDRMAHAALAAEDRVTFTVALVRHVARHLAENEREYLGPEAAGDAAYEDRFVDRYNEVAGHYAEFGADPTAPDDGSFHPAFGFVRYLGVRLEPTVPEKDRRWIVDQVMATEVPEALGLVQRAMRDLHDPAPRPRRRSAGQSGE
jgi:hypothetical protein